MLEASALMSALPFFLEATEMAENYRQLGLFRYWPVSEG